MQKYMGGLVLLGVFPLLYCLIYYFRDSIDYITLEEGVDVEDTDIFMWQVRISFYFYYKMFMLGTQGIKQILFKPRSMNQTMQKLSFIIRRETHNSLISPTGTTIWTYVVLICFSCTSSTWIFIILCLELSTGLENTNSFQKIAIVFFPHLKSTKRNQNIRFLCFLIIFF